MKEINGVLLEYAGLADGSTNEPTSTKEGNMFDLINEFEELKRKHAQEIEDGKIAFAIRSEDLHVGDYTLKSGEFDPVWDGDGWAIMESVHHGEDGAN